MSNSTRTIQIQINADNSAAIASMASLGSSSASAMGGVRSSIESTFGPFQRLKETIQTVAAAFEIVTTVVTSVVNTTLSLVNTWAELRGENDRLVRKLNDVRDIFDVLGASVVDVVAQALEASGAFDILTGGADELRREIADANTSAGEFVREGLSKLVDGFAFVAVGIVRVVTLINAIPNLLTTVQSATEGFFNEAASWADETFTTNNIADLEAAEASAQEQVAIWTRTGGFMREITELNLARAQEALANQRDVIAVRERGAAEAQASATSASDALMRSLGENLEIEAQIEAARLAMTNSLQNSFDPVDPNAAANLAEHNRLTDIWKAARDRRAQSERDALDRQAALATRAGEAAQRDRDRARADAEERARDMFAAMSTGGAAGMAANADDMLAKMKDLSAAATEAQRAIEAAATEERFRVLAKVKDLATKAESDLPGLEDSFASAAKNIATDWASGLSTMGSDLGQMLASGTASFRHFGDAVKKTLATSFGSIGSAFAQAGASALFATGGGAGPFALFAGIGALFGIVSGLLSGGSGGATGGGSAHSQRADTMSTLRPESTQSGRQVIIQVNTGPIFNERESQSAVVKILGRARSMGETRGLF